MVYSLEVMPDVCFECVTLNVILVSRVIRLFSVLRDFSLELVEAFECSDCAFSFSACVTVKDEYWFKYVLEDIDQCVVHYPVAEITYADQSGLRVAQHKLLQRHRFVNLCSQFAEQDTQIESPVLLKFHDFWVVGLVFPCLPIGMFKVLEAV